MRQSSKLFAQSEAYKMDKQIILACDEQGNFTGEYITKEEGHSGQGKRHLAITILVYNSKNEVLLQKRKHKIFDGIWDITGATHHLHGADGKDESSEEATARCLNVEYGIKGARLESLGGFNYFAQDGENCENEHCIMMLGKYDGEIKLNLEVGYEYKWMDKDEFLADIKTNPDKYSQWAKEGVKILKQTNFFDD